MTRYSMIVDEEINGKVRILSVKDYESTVGKWVKFSDYEAEIEKLKDLLKQRIGIYYHREVPHQSKIPICRCRKCVDARIKETLGR